MLPWMTSAEIDCIKTYLKSTDQMLEWGSGGSTMYYSQFVQKYVSVEHNPDWYAKMSSQVPSNVILNFVPMNGSKYTDYIMLPKILGWQYDRILVDGRQRVACADVARDILLPGGTMFVHDYTNRAKYHSIKNQWNLVKTCGTLAVFMKK